VLFNWRTWIIIAFLIFNNIIIFLSINVLIQFQTRYYFIWRNIIRALFFQCRLTFWVPAPRTARYPFSRVKTPLCRARRPDGHRLACSGGARKVISYLLGVFTIRWHKVRYYIKALRLLLSIYVIVVSL